MSQTHSVGEGEIESVNVAVNGVGLKLVLLLVVRGTTHADVFAIEKMSWVVGLFDML